MNSKMGNRFSSGKEYINIEKVSRELLYVDDVSTSKLNKLLANCLKPRDFI